MLMAALRKALTLFNVKPLLRYQTAGIVSKTQLDLLGPRAPPFPYDDTEYTTFQAFFDKTTYRFDENSKVIVVDGPVAAGKTEFAKTIAKGLDMQYIPPVNLDIFYINEYGYDSRELNDKLPEAIRSFDVHQFLENPNHPRAASFQMMLLNLRLSDYINALAHLMSTGQGVVLNRSIYSDFVFMETMAKFGFISKEVRKHYYNVKYHFITSLMRPHLVIYLDVPVNVVLQRIKERNRPGEKNSPFLRPEVLQYMEEVYKQRYLKHITKHSELLAYDWSEKGDPEVVIEDIENVNVDDYTVDSPKMSDWRRSDEWDWCVKRQQFTLLKEELMNQADIAVAFDSPELYMSGEHLVILEDALENSPGGEYASGYNADMGDGPILFKTTRSIFKACRKNF